MAENTEKPHLSPVSSHVEHVLEAQGLDGLSLHHHDLDLPDYDDVNHPKNWSLAARLTTYLTICSFTFLANVNGSNFTIATAAIVKEFQVSQTQAGGLVCFNVFTFGLGNIFWVPLMRVVGKRPVYLLALLALCLLNVWTSKANSYGELLASRVCSGFAAAAGDATVPAVVADLVNPRDRGHYMMFFHFAMTTGLFVGPLFNSFLVEYRNWRWMCDLVAIVAGVLFVVAFFTIRETSYLESRVTDSSRYTKRSQWQWMSLKWGYNRDASYIQAVWDILTLAAYPQLIWCAITIGVSVGWNIVVQLTSSRTFLLAPYNWKLYDLGLLSLSGFIGSVLAFYLGGRLIDVIAMRSAVRHGGSHKPEYRLPAIIIPGVIGPAGILIFGLCVANKTKWVGPAVGYAMQAFSVAAISNVTVTYCLDSYKPVTGEALVIIFVIRNTIGMLLSLYAANWIERQGAVPVFCEMASIQVALILFAIPLYFYGQSLRDSTSRYGPMKRLQSE